jgi:PAS domain S-box-containing protein
MNKVLNDRYLSLLMQLPTAVSVCKGKDLRIELANKKSLEIWGKSKEEVLSKPVFEVFPELLDQGFDSIINDVVQNGKRFEAKELPVELVRHGKKETLFINFAYDPLSGPTGEIEGFIATGVDVTELVLARKAADEAYTKFRNVVELAPDPILILKGEEMILEVANSALFELWQVDESALNKPFLEILPEMKDQPFLGLLRNVLHSGESFFGVEVPATFKRKSGKMETLYVNFSYQPFREKDGKITGVLVLATNVTEQVISKQQLEAKNKELEDLAATLEQKVENRTKDFKELNESLLHANEELEQFAYVASHDLQEPLRKIRVYTNMATEFGDLSPQVETYLHKVMTSASRMSDLIKSLLDYSRTNVGRVRKVPVDLKEIITLILSDYELLLGQKEAVVEVGDLPVVYSLPLPMNQLFFNLLGNSLKFTRKGVKPVIKIGCEKISKEEMAGFPSLSPSTDFVKIWVQDNGIGFDQEYAGKIFTIFQRLTERSQYGGYGIGLALCKKVVESNGGIIYAQGKSQEGATFTVILPLYK